MAEIVEYIAQDIVASGTALAGVDFNTIKTAVDSVVDLGREFV